LDLEAWGRGTEKKSLNYNRKIIEFIDITGFSFYNTNVSIIEESF
jgi:hypothetical protein